MWSALADPNCAAEKAIETAPSTAGGDMEFVSGWTHRTHWRPSSFIYWLLRIVLEIHCVHYVHNGGSTASGLRPGASAELGDTLASAHTALPLKKCALQLSPKGATEVLGRRTYCGTELFAGSARSNFSLVGSAIHVTSRTSNSTNVRLMRQKSALFE